MGWMGGWRWVGWTEIGLLGDSPCAKDTTKFGGRSPAEGLRHSLVNLNELDAELGSSLPTGPIYLRR